MSKQPIFTGSGVAIVTPFTENNEVNYPLLGELIDFQIENGTDAIIICGTTGEGSTLTHEEHAGAIQFAVDHTARAAMIRHMPFTSPTKRKKQELMVCSSLLPIITKPPRQA